MAAPHGLAEAEIQMRQDDVRRGGEVNAWDRGPEYYPETRSRSETDERGPGSYSEIGKKGGENDQGGSEFYSEIGKKGGETTNQDRQQMSDIGRKVGHSRGGHRSDYGTVENPLVQQEHRTQQPSTWENDKGKQQQQQGTEDLEFSQLGTGKTQNRRQLREKDQGGMSGQEFGMPGQEFGMTEKEFGMTEKDSLMQNQEGGQIQTDKKLERETFQGGDVHGSFQKPGKKSGQGRRGQNKSSKDT